MTLHLVKTPLPRRNDTVTRLYEDPEEEAKSIMAWLDRRLVNCNNSDSFRLYVDIFKAEWKASFGTLETIPEDYIAKILKLHEQIRGM